MDSDNDDKNCTDKFIDHAALLKPDRTNSDAHMTRLLSKNINEEPEDYPEKLENLDEKAGQEAQQ